MTLRTSTTAALAAAVPGGVLRAGDPGYADASTTFFGAGTPDLVIRPRTAADVAAAVRHARDARLALTVRCGGHSSAGWSTHTEGLLLDLSLLDSVELVDPGRRVVRVGGGATWGRVAQVLQPHGLGLTAGDTKGVGVGGLTLGGGIGWMVRRHGLTIDSLVGADIVTADGDLLRLDQEQNPELFWAIRGGGGNFGVVVSFDFRAQPVTEVVFGTVTFALDDPRSLVRAWRDEQRSADEGLTTVLNLLPALGENPATATLRLCFDGDGAAASQVVDPLLRIGPVLSTEIATRPYAEVLDEVHQPTGMRIGLRNGLLPELTDAGVDAVLDLCSARPTAIALRALGGAFSRVDPGATAFAHRSAEVMVVAARFQPGVSGPDGEQDLLPDWPAVAAHATGSYANFLDTAADPDLAGVHPASTRCRLARVKAEHDPDNLFRRNHNIRPVP